MSIFNKKNTATGVSNAAAQPQQQAPGQTPAQTNTFEDNSDNIKNLWRLATLETEFEEQLKKSRIKNAKDGSGFSIEFENGKSLFFRQDDKLGEFIGTKEKIDADDAVNMISACKSRGWKKVDVHGTDEDKDMLWIAAQRAGLEVSNYNPPANSVVAQAWEQEKAAAAAAAANPAGVTQGQTTQTPAQTQTQTQQTAGQTQAGQTQTGQTQTAQTQTATAAATTGTNTANNNSKYVNPQQTSQFTNTQPSAAAKTGQQQKKSVVGKKNHQRHANRNAKNLKP